MPAVQLRRKAKAAEAVVMIFILDSGDSSTCTTRVLNLSRLPGCVDELLLYRTGGGRGEGLMRGEVYW